MSNLRTALLCILPLSPTVFGQPGAVPDTVARLQNLEMPLGLMTPAATRGLELPGANKIDPRLRNLLTATGAERTERSISLGAANNGRLPVVVEARAIADVQQAENAIRVQNGEVEADFENTIWARVPPNAVTPLATLATVSSLLVQPEERLRQEPEDGLTTRGTSPFGDGVKAAQMQLLHQRGITGKGVRIGILDGNFKDYSKLQREGRVKKPLAQKTFGDVARFESGDVHGTACAEIISAAAPDAELLLANFDSREGSMMQAAQWLISQGAQIISYSMGSTMRPTDGSDAVSRFVERTSRQNGVLWVVSAGNDGRTHWMGWSDPGEDTVIKVSSELQKQGVVVESTTNHLRVIVRWDDWGPDPQKPSSNQDIDAYLWAASDDGKSFQIVAKSTETQNGGASLPMEIIDYESPKVANQQFLVALKARHVTRRLKVHVFVDQEDRAFVVFPSIAAGSISSPASARSALAVGAVDVKTKQITDYSSEGPTDDNRLKPDVSAPTNTVSFAYAAEGGRFPGTSSSCPHVAGFAALLKQMNPQATGLDLRTLVMQSVVPQGTPHPNDLYGYGHIDGGAVREARAKMADTAPTPQTAGAIAVPAEFGGTVSVATIRALRGLVNEPRDGLSVRLVSGRDLYRIGDGMRLGFQASEDCSCLLFIRDSLGKYSVFTPEESRYFMLSRGAPYLLPHAADETLEVTGPAGAEELLLVCAGQPVNLNTAVSGRTVRGLAVANYSYVIEGKDP